MTDPAECIGKLLFAVLSSRKLFGFQSSTGVEESWRAVSGHPPEDDVSISDDRKGVGPWKIPAFNFQGMAPGRGRLVLPTETIQTELKLAADDFSVEQAIFDRAVSAYARHCDRKGWSYQQPGRYDSGIDQERRVIDLCNTNGHLATYRIVETEQGFRLEHVDDPSAEIDDLIDKN